MNSFMSKTSRDLTFLSKILGKKQRKRSGNHKRWSGRAAGSPREPGQGRPRARLIKNIPLRVILAQHPSRVNRLNGTNALFNETLIM